MTDNILKYWPMKQFSPRETQVKVLQWIEELPSNIKYILCEIPVGGGKSPIGINMSGFASHSAGNSYIFTPQKILQKQYQDSFEKEILFSLYGKGNYSCKPKETNCDIGADIKPRCVDCPHRNAIADARNSNNLVVNYTLGLLLSKLSEELKFGKRKLVVFDEAHTIEHHLTEFSSLQIGERRCKQFNVTLKIPNNELEAIDWITRVYMPAVKNEYHKLSQIVAAIESRYSDGAESMDRADAEFIYKLKDVVTHMESLNEYIALPEDVLIQKYALIKDKSYFKFKPLYGKDVFNTYLKNMGERFLFMTSTILNKDEFCKDLGIPPEEAAFISVDSEFELENRPVIYEPVMKMTYGWDKPENKSSRQKYIKKLISTLDDHSDDSGIIHTGSFVIADWLIRELEGKIPHQIVHHNPESGFTRDEVIDQFVSNNGAVPMVLISPSITEGLDLKGDKGRFSIIAKVPYPYLGDNWVKRRQELSREWYSRQAAIAIIQASGRVTRSHDDWGYTYVFDESFGALIKSYSKHLPKWFKDSIIRA